MLSRSICAIDLSHCASNESVISAAINTGRWCSTIDWFLKGGTVDRLCSATGGNLGYTAKNLRWRGSRCLYPQYFVKHSDRCTVSHCTYQNMIRLVLIFANWKTGYTTETNLTPSVTQIPKTYKHRIYTHSTDNWYSPLLLNANWPTTWGFL